jgi:hypothetical protein
MAPNLKRESFPPSLHKENGAKIQIYFMNDYRKKMAPKKEVSRHLEKMTPKF